jgi:hypothetical protein
MNNDCLAAKKILDGGNTCVIAYNGMVLTSKKEGLDALLDFINSKFDFSMFSAAVDYIDKAKAILLLKLGIKTFITYKLTNDAKLILEKYSINSNYKELVDEIDCNYKTINEKLKDIEDYTIGYNLIMENKC